MALASCEPSFLPWDFFSPLKNKYKKEAKIILQGKQEILFSPQLILMKLYNPDGMNNSIYERADRDVGHGPTGKLGGAGENAQIQIPHGQLLALRS